MSPGFSRIAVTATNVVTGIHVCFSHNCHNCNNCFRYVELLFSNIFVKIFRGPRTHVFVKYFAVLRLCCACSGPLTNWNSMDTGTQLSSVFQGMCSLGRFRVLLKFRYAKLLFSYIFVKNISRSSDTCFRKIFRGPRTTLHLRRAAYKLEFYGHRAGA